MSIESTQHLSKLSHEEIKIVHHKWPNPLLPLGFMMGGLAVMMYGLFKHNQGESSFGMLVGSFAAFIILTLGSSIFGLIKVSKAKKVLNNIADQHSLPKKELLKEFKQNLRHMKAL